MLPGADYFFILCLDMDAILVFCNHKDIFMSIAGDSKKRSESSSSTNIFVFINVDDNLFASSLEKIEPSRCVINNGMRDY